MYLTLNSPSLDTNHIQSLSVLKHKLDSPFTILSPTIRGECNRSLFAVPRAPALRQSGLRLDVICYSSAMPKAARRTGAATAYEHPHDEGSYDEDVLGPWRSSLVKAAIRSLFDDLVRMVDQRIHQASQLDLSKMFFFFFSVKTSGPG